MRYWYKKNKLQQLRGFCTVIEEGSILKASKKMNIAQSSVSVQISSLERDLKIQLFRREKKRLIVTPEALRFYKVFKRQLEEINMVFENTSKVIKHDYDDTIRLAGHSYMLSHILPAYFKKILKVNPNTRFELWNSSYEEAFDMLNNGIIDMAIYPVSTPIKFKNIEVCEFYKCHFAIAMDKAHPLATVQEKDITWNMLSKHDFLTMGKGMTAQGLKAVIQANAIDSRFTLHNGTWEIGMGMIKEGLTISCGDIEYAKWHNDIVVKKCENLIPEYQFHILTNKNSLISNASKQLLEILKEKV